MGPHQSARIEPLDAAWTYDDSHFNAFNLVMFDHGVYAQPYEHLETVFTQSSTLILVINRDLSARGWRSIYWMRSSALTCRAAAKSYGFSSVSMRITLCTAMSCAMMTLSSIWDARWR
ncbi:hypothetical protein DMH27_05325 [Raoultella planticola]|nr:hypothetical protein [Raoultella planticola]